MVIEISDKLIQKTGLNQHDVLLGIAILLFQEEKLTLAQAAELAEIHQIEFQKELAKRKIPIHYGEADFLTDLETISQMK